MQSCLEVQEKVAKKGEQYTCEECGVTMVVADPCGCAPCDLVCCGVPMKEVKEAKPKAAAKPKAKKK